MIHNASPSAGNVWSADKGYHKVAATERRHVGTCRWVGCFTKLPLGSHASEYCTFHRKLIKDGKGKSC